MPYSTIEACHEKTATVDGSAPEQKTTRSRRAGPERRRSSLVGDSRLEKFGTFQQFKETVGTAPGANAVLNNLNLEIAALDRRRRELRERLDQITDSWKELQSEIDLVRRSGPFRREDLNELETSMSLRRDDYKQAVATLGKSVNRARHFIRSWKRTPVSRPRSRQRTSRSRQGSKLCCKPTSLGHTRSFSASRAG